MKGPIQAWHFARDDRRLGAALGYHDQSIEVVPGLTLGHNHRELEPCVAGLHASIDPLDALQYAPGSFVSRVELRGKILEHGRGDRPDKLCVSWRRHLWCADATGVLLAFSRWCALEVIGLWDAPEVVRRYLETGDEELRVAAQAAAWTAARTAALAAQAAAWAAWAAARNAAWTAARDAARNAARDAARAAAWTARHHTARDAAWHARDAVTWTAARDAVREAVREKQSQKLEEMLLTLKEVEV